MGRVIIIILAISVIFAFIGSKQPDNTMDTVIEYGESNIYSLEDRQEAVGLILGQAGRWDSIEQLHNVRYGGDGASLEEKGYGGYDKIMVFYSDFKTRKHLPNEGFNQDSEYQNWSWILGKTTNGQWKLLTWGY